MLDGFEELKICVAYDLDGERIDHLPTAAAPQARVKPIYETLRRLDAVDRGRALLGRAAGAGDQVRRAASRS